MIRCFVALCLVANPAHCKPEVEIEPASGATVTSPMQCGRGGLVYFAQFRMARQTPGSERPVWFARVRSKMDGDGSDIVQTWLADQRARAAASRPQIK